MVDLLELHEGCKTMKDLENEKMSGDEIYKILVYFDKLYDTVEDIDKQRFFKYLIVEIQSYEEPVGNQWLKFIRFRFSLIGESYMISLGNDTHIEPVILLSSETRYSKKSSLALK